MPPSLARAHDPITHANLGFHLHKRMCFDPPRATDPVRMENEPTTLSATLGSRNPFGFESFRESLLIWKPTYGEAGYIGEKFKVQEKVIKKQGKFITKMGKFLKKLEPFLLTPP